MIDFATLLWAGMTTRASSFGFDRSSSRRVLDARIPPCVAFGLGRFVGSILLSHFELYCIVFIRTGLNSCLQTLQK